MDWIAVGTVPVVAGAESPGPDGGNGYLNYLFDGTGAGSGAVTVSWIYYGKVVVRNNFNLQLQTVSQMYEKASVINSSWVHNDIVTLMVWLSVLTRRCMAPTQNWM